MFKICPQYSAGVLIGNWVEDAIECPKQGTLYIPPKETIDYDKMKPRSRRHDLRGNRLIGIQGNVCSVIKHDSHEKGGNFATTTDLIYNHFPKPLCGPKNRRYKRAKHAYDNEPDLINCYGNVTEFGLRTYKESLWKCETMGDRDTSVYFDTYVRPKPDEYLPRRERRGKDATFTKTFRYKMTKSKT